MKNQVVIIIPIYKETLSAYEEISLKRCVEILKLYPIVFVCPYGIHIKEYEKFFSAKNDYSFAYFNKTYFINTDSYNKLLLNIKFYRYFKSFEYILIYQLDAYVFRDELKEWCAKGFDYIGAPWLEHNYHLKNNLNFVGVGNGGFSLRKVSSCLKVLKSFSYAYRVGYIYYLLISKPITFPSLFQFFKNLTVQNNTFYLFNNYHHNEDVFWGIVAKRNFKWFNVPPVSIALEFSVEVAPSKIILAKENLPFGCHAWWKYDFPFWRNYIHIPEGYPIKKHNE